MIVAKGIAPDVVIAARKVLRSYRRGELRGAKLFKSGYVRLAVGHRYRLVLFKNKAYLMSHEKYNKFIRYIK